MAKRWLQVALIAAGFALAGQARAQKFSCGESFGQGGPGFAGPLPAKMAPPGPGGDLSLPANLPNAFDDPCCGPPEGFCCLGMWFSAEYLHTWLQDPQLSTPLVTTGGTGTLPGAQIVVGSDSLDTENLPGARFGVGFWLDPERRWSIEGYGFVTDKTESEVRVDQVGGAPPLFLPFLDLTTGLENAQAVTNGVSVTSAAQIWGAEANLVWAFDSVALFGGFRYADLTEEIETQAGISATTILRDHFGTRNQFSGGQFGVRISGNLFCGPWFAIQAKCAVGSNHESVLIFGDTTTFGGVLPTTTPTALFAHTSNTGRFQQDSFSMIPEAEFRIGWQVNRNITIYAAANYLYWYKVLRPGQQISHATLPVGTNTLPGPIVPFTESDIWAAGASFGFEMRY